MWAGRAQVTIGRRGIVLVLIALIPAGALASPPMPLQPRNMPATILVADAVIEHETAISEITKEHIPGERLVNGRVTAIRSDQIVVDIGNPEPLYLPLKPALDKRLVFHVGDPIVVTMNDHNAVVDYHHSIGQSRHEVIYGQLIEPLTVGQDKAVVRSTQGERSYPIASRARGKLGAMPIGADLVFLLDETGQLVDAQLASQEAVYQSGLNNKAGKLMGSHRRVGAVYKGAAQEINEIRVVTGSESQEQALRFRPPLSILDQLHHDQPIVLLLDDENYVVDIATSDPPPRQYRPDSNAINQPNTFTQGERR